MIQNTIDINVKWRQYLVGKPTVGRLLITKCWPNPFMAYLLWMTKCWPVLRFGRIATVVSQAQPQPYSLGRRHLNTDPDCWAAFVSWMDGQLITGFRSYGYRIIGHLSWMMLHRIWWQENVKVVAICHHFWWFPDIYFRKPIGWTVNSWLSSGQWWLIS